MLFRKQRISQVKCNFCLQWMSLRVDVKCSINVCDACLKKACQDNKLKAVNSLGQIYQLYMVRQNSLYQLQPQPNTINYTYKMSEIENNIRNQQSSNKAQLLCEMDQKRNVEIKEILLKWTTLTELLCQKQSLSEQQINSLKETIDKKTIQLEKPNQDIPNQAQPLQNQPTPYAKDFQTHSQQDNCQEQQETTELFENLIIPSNNINIADYQIENKQILSPKSIKKTKLKQQQNYNLFKPRTSLKNPTKNTLKEKDLNCLRASLTNLKDLKYYHQTSEKDHQSIYFDENSSITSSFLKKSYGMFQKSQRFSSRSLILRNFTQQMNDQQLRKFQQTKQRIIKHLQKTSGSTSLTRLMFSIIIQAYSHTSILGKSLQLISYNLSLIDFRCYLQAFQWTGIQVLKFVKTNLTDSQLKILVEFILSQNLGIKVLVLTNNKLTEASIEYLNEKELGSVKEIYLGRNAIHKGRVRSEIKSLGRKYSLYL